MPAKKSAKTTKKVETKKTVAEEKVTTKKAATAKKETSKTTVTKTKEKKETVKKSEPKKTTTTKAATKPAVVKAEPKKVEVKKAEAKPKAASKTTAKKEETPKAVAKPAVKAETKKATPAKKAEAKPATAKKEEAPKVAKKTVAKKAEPKKETKASAKKAETKKTTKTAAKKTTTKKAATKKATTKKVATKKTTAKKTTTKKVTVSKAQQEKMNQYNSFSLDTCFEMARAMGVEVSYDDIESKLLDEVDTKVLAAKIVSDYGVQEKGFTFDKDGYDADLIQVIVDRIASSVVIKASDFKGIRAEIKKHQKYAIKDDDTANNEEYHAMFDLVRQVLMMAQRKNITSTYDMKKMIGESPEELIIKFMDVAYKVLVHWTYDDVKYYENFIYATLSQLNDMHEKYGVRAMMDVADLYIEHGDYGLGDANYEYILRENQIKDYIYLRYASIYYNSVDREKAKAIAHASLQYVDDRYTYYPDIISILEN